MLAQQQPHKRAKLTDSLEFKSSLEVVLAEEGGQIGDHPVVDTSITLELGSKPFAIFVGGSTVRQWIILEPDRTGSIVVRPAKWRKIRRLNPCS